MSEVPKLGTRAFIYHSPIALIASQNLPRVVIIGKPEPSPLVLDGRRGMYALSPSIQPRAEQTAVWRFCFAALLALGGQASRQVLGQARCVRFGSQTELPLL